MARRHTIGIALGLAVIAADQLTKWWIAAWVMQPPRRIPVLPFFDLVLAWNRGISFGMFDAGSVWGPWLLSGIALVIVGFLGVWFRRAEMLSTTLALGLIMGGALGNVIDRVRLGAVIDFIDLHAGGYHWPAFNVADAAITVGAVLLIVETLFSPARKKRNIEDT